MDPYQKRSMLEITLRITSKPKHIFFSLDAPRPKTVSIGQDVVNRDWCVAAPESECNDTDNSVRPYGSG